MSDVSRLPGTAADHWDWQRHAACRGMDSAVFFHPEGERGPARRKRVEHAAAICAGCPVAGECREWARRVGETYGVWGGESEIQRREVLDRGGSTRPGAPARPA